MARKDNTDQVWVDCITEFAAVDHPLFFNFCVKLSKGLRKEGLASLRKFIDASKTWNDDQRIHFTKELFGRFDHFNNLVDILVYPLSEELVSPALEEFIAREPENFFPYYWKGKYLRVHYDLKKAYRLNPSYQPLQQALLKSLDYFLWTSTHHLPYGYGGSIEEDMADVMLAKEIISKSGEHDPVLIENLADYESELLDYVKRKTT